MSEPSPEQMRESDLSVRRDLMKSRAADLEGHDPAGAIALLREVLEKAPQDLQALKALASVYFRLQQFKKAEVALRKLLLVDEGNAHAWNALAICLSAMGMNEEARKSFEEATQRNPDEFAFQQNLAKAYEKENRWAEAAETYRKALRMEPKSPDCLHGLAAMSSNLGNYVELLTIIDRLTSVRSLSLQERLFRVEALIRLEKINDARSEIETVLREEPNNALAHYLKGASYQEEGKHDIALEEFKLAIELDPKLPPSYWYLTQSKRFGEEESQYLPQMEGLAIADDTAPLGRGVLQFALGVAYNDLAKYEQAMAHFEEANRIFRELQMVRFSEDAQHDFTDMLIQIFSKEYLASMPSLADPTELPLFIVGMPRSGTTLAESTISAHPLVAAGGEISFWPHQGPKALDETKRIIDSELALGFARSYMELLCGIGPNALRVTDKLPFNYRHIGLLHMLFPNARFVHCRRHPVDNCLSFFMTTFNHPPSFSFDKRHIVSAYREYARLMAHWKEVIPKDRLYELRYEEFVSDHAVHTRRLIEFCGLDWNGACLHPEANDRIISTMSHWQARQPVYKSSTERWKRYEPWLGEFRSLIDDPPQFG